MEPNMMKTGMNIIQKLSQKLIMNYTIQLDRKIKANKADIIVKHKREKTCKLMDVFSIFPADKDVSVSKFEKLSKYKYLKIKVEKLWHRETVTIPVVFEALWMVTRQEIV